jgi:hypothetical protein
MFSYFFLNDTRLWLHEKKGQHSNDILSFDESQYQFELFVSMMFIITCAAFIAVMCNVNIIMSYFLWIIYKCDEMINACRFFF